MQRDLIELESVGKRYGQHWAVEELSLRVAAGELFVFLGPNGAGKTTTIKMIAGLLKPSRGVARVAGHDMSDDDPAARSVISYIPDLPHVYEKLSGREFLRFVRDLHELHDPSIDAEEERWIATFEMASFVDDLAETYSHGMRQRLAFAAAMLHRPKLLVVDEPMVGLDPRSARIVKNVLRDHARGGGAVFMSTHALPMAEEMADRIAIIHRGRLLCVGTPAELRSKRDVGDTLEDFFLRATAEAIS